MIKWRAVFLAFVFVILMVAAGPVFAVATGVDFSGVDAPAIEGGTISLPGLGEQPLQPASECDPEIAECPDPGFDWYFETDQPLKPGTTGTATIETGGESQTVTFTAQPFFTLTLTPAITDAMGRVIANVDPLGNRTEYAYDDAGRVISETNAEGEVTRISYDEAGNAATADTDSAGRTIIETDPPGAATPSEYDAAGRAVAVTDATGGVTRTEYDVAGRTITLTDPQGAATRTEYDAAGRAVETLHADHSRTEYRYDRAGRVIETIEIKSSTEPVNVGPRADVGTVGVGQKLVKGAAGKLLGGLLGGGRSKGGGKSKGPKTRRDPTRKGETTLLTDPETGAAVWVRAKWVEDGLLFSTHIEKSKDKGTFQTVFLEDQEGGQMPPLRIAIYKIWVKHTLTVSWTKSTYVDGGLVSRETGGWTETWTRDLGVFKRRAQGDELANIPPIWRLAGYGRAHAGVRRLGTVFQLTPGDLQNMGPLRLIVHITRPSLDPVMTVPFALEVRAGGGDLVLVDSR